MTITVARAQCYRYTLPIHPPLMVGTDQIAERNGALLRIEGEDGAVGWGEAAPLPGFSEETPEEVLSVLQRVSDRLVGETWHGSTLEEVLETVAFEGGVPSVRFAVESALIEMTAATWEQPVHQVLGGGSSTVALNALIPADEDDPAAAAERLRVEGYRAVKLKVGRSSVAADGKRVRQVVRTLGDEISLRLDANRAWTVEEALRFADAIGDVAVEYVEEPLRTPNRLGAFADASGLPVALDETTRETSPGGAPIDSLAAVVLKPTLLGGVVPVWRWAQWARTVGAMPVISAAYESGVGLRMLVALASTVSSAPVGLSTYARLETDVLAPPLQLEQPTIDVAAAYDSELVPARLTLLDPDL